MSRPEWGGQILLCGSCNLGFALVAYTKSDFELLRYTRANNNECFMTTDSPSRQHELFEPQHDGRFAPAKVSKILEEGAALFQQTASRPQPIAAASIFLEVVFLNVDFPFDGRDAVEDPLSDALEQASLGEVTGGGCGSETCNVDIEVVDLERGLSLIRSTLLGLGCPNSTVINQYQPTHVVHSLS